MSAISLRFPPLSYRLSLLSWLPLSYPLLPSASPVAASSRSRPGLPERA